MLPLLCGILLLGMAIGWFIGPWRHRSILQSKRHLETIFDHIDPIAVVDADFHILRVNRAFLRLSERGFRELLGSSLADLLHHWGLPGADLKAISEADERAVLHERRFRLNGDEHFFDLRIYPVSSAAGHQREQVIHLQDVTELTLARRRADEATGRLKELNRELSARNADLKSATDAIDAEINVAREIQRGLLPQTFPDIPGLRTFVRYQPTRPVGGDLYDFIQLDEYRVGVFIADVSGHGLPAAFEGAMVKMSFLHHARPDRSPAEVLHHMNTDLRRSLAPGHYVTAFYGIVDVVDHNITYCRAAHPKPLLQHADGSWEHLEGHGLFIGIVDDGDYRDDRRQLAQGDHLHLFTDGYYEGLERDGHKGYQALQDALSTGLPVDLALTEIERSLDREDGKEDDRTFLCLELTRPARLDRFQLLARFLPGLPLQVRRVRTGAEASAAAEAFCASLSFAGWPLRLAKRLRLAADEMCANAIEHGLQGREGGKAWAAWSVTAEECRFAIHDNGDGFNPDALPDPRAIDRIHLSRGRGIFMTRQSVDRLWFDHGGRTATFLYRLKGDDQ